MIVVTDLDCRGLACPQPVLKTKEALDAVLSGMVKVIVDNDAAKENVTRFAISRGYQVTASVSGQDHILCIIKSGPESSPAPEISCTAAAGTPRRVVLKICSEFMGQGSEELGRVLMKAFLNSVSQTISLPQTIIFYNSGVRLACTGSAHLEVLQNMANAGVRILACGTCLDYYHLKTDLVVGQVTNMFEIVETLQGADLIVSP